MSASRVAHASVTLAGTSIAQPIGTAIDLARLPPIEGHAIDGILGADFIGRYVVTIDYAKSELRLDDPRRFTYGGGGDTIPITLIDRYPHVDATITLAGGDTLGGRFVIDVGSGAALALARPFVDDHDLRDRVGPTIRRSGGGGVGGPASADVGRVADFSIGRFHLLAPIVQLFGDSAGLFSRRTSWVGNIGGAILRRFTVTFDYTHRRMILEPNATIGDRFEADMSGLQLAMTSDGAAIRIVGVSPASPGSDAGLSPGDVIVAIDGVPASARALAQLRDERFRVAGQHVTLTVERDGHTRRVDLVTRRMI